MKTQPQFSLRNPWLATSLGLTAALAGATALAGLVLFPLTQKNFRANGIWDAICSAAGVPRQPSASTVASSAFKTSNVILGSDVAVRPSAIAVGHGATLAQRCSMCHGADTRKARFPVLAGQPAEVIRKQLRDFQTGARTNAVMSPFAIALRDQDVVDVAAYFSYLPRATNDVAVAAVPVPRVVETGAPMRNIPPCGSCHGRLDTKVGAPWLDGQPADYLKAQLQAFANGSRHNDISGQMRNVARLMTPPEIEAVSSYFASQP